MKPKKLTPSKNKAQAMVEFAIALPILLMLLYGLLETGRLLFTYSSVVNATRQAVRWGSTTGVGTDGVTSRYKDCAGIRASAQRGDFLNVFDDADIKIWYDNGPNTGGYPGIGTCPMNINGNLSRINVSIDYDFKAIVPKLVPFVSRTINATSARTIITSITISQATATPSKTPTPTFTPTFTPSNTPTITKTFTPGPSPTNTKTFTPAPPTATATLAPAACAVKYTPNSWSNGFTADVIITNNSSTAINGWTLAWSYTAGQIITNYWNTSLTQTGASITASNLSWNATINANGGTQNFGFQGTHTGNNPSPASFTLNGQPCTGGVAAPTATLTPSLTPTTIPTGVSCSQLSHGPITFSGSNMSMTIDNTSGVAMAIQNIQVWWNYDTGRGTGPGDGNGDLELQNSALNGAIYWNGNQTAASYIITPSSSINIPTGSSTISFKFKYTYALQNGTERIYINISTPGCGFLDSDT